ncbi:hypothetical protein BBP40_003453 [Aspergillus hancockii]|nr:hypothetical protein BBP40_003453 [Aspergillus hancockii]
MLMHEDLEQDERRSTRDMVDQVEDVSQPKRSIKITPVKMFAENLAKANFIPTTITISFLPNGVTVEKVAKEYIARAAIMARNPIKFDSRLGRIVVSTMLSGDYEGFEV